MLPKWFDARYCSYAHSFSPPTATTRFYHWAWFGTESRGSWQLGSKLGTTHDAGWQKCRVNAYEIGIHTLMNLSFHYPRTRMSAFYGITYCSTRALIHFSIDFMKYMNFMVTEWTWFYRLHRTKHILINPRRAIQAASIRGTEGSKVYFTLFFLRYRGRCTKNWHVAVASLFLPSEAQVNCTSGKNSVYLGFVQAKLCHSIRRYSSTSKLDTSVRCLANSCAIQGESEV